MKTASAMETLARHVCKRSCVLLVLIGVAFGAHAQRAGEAVVLGQTLSLSGTSAAIGRALLKGRQACAEWVNRHSGISGRPIALLTRDDKGDSRMAVENVRELLANPQVLALLGPMGTHITQAAIPSTAGQIAMVAPFGGDVASRRGAKDHVFFTTANQSAEAERLASHVSAVGLKRVAVIHSADASGQAALLAFEEALSVVEASPRAVVSVQADGAGAAEAMRSVAEADVQAVLLATTGAVTTAVLRALAGRGQGPLLQVYGMSSSASLGDLVAMGNDARGFSMTQVLPSPRDPRLPIAAQFREAMGSDAPGASYLEMEGCTSVLVLAEVLRGKSGTLTRTNVLHAFRSAGTLDVGGFTVDFRDRVRGSAFTDIVFMGPSGRAIR